MDANAYLENACQIGIIVMVIVVVLAKISSDRFDRKYGHGVDRQD